MGGRSWIGDPPSNPGLSNPNLKPAESYWTPDPEPMPIRQGPKWWRELRHWSRAGLGFLIAALAFLGALTALALIPDAPQQQGSPGILFNPSTDRSPDLAITTRYRVEGTGRADVTYRALDGDETAVNVALPWSMELDTVGPVLTARSRSGEVTTIRCEIEQYGAEVAAANSKGSLATCTAVAVGLVG